VASMKLAVTLLASMVWRASLRPTTFDTCKFDNAEPSPAKAAATTLPVTVAPLASTRSRSVPPVVNPTWLGPGR